MTAELVTIGPQGRIVIPARIREALDLEPGQTLVARVEADHVVLEPREAVIARIRRRFAHIPRSRSLSAELLRERRMEARREGRKERR